MGCEFRDRNYHHILTWIATYHPGWPVFTGVSDRTPFSPAQARNNGAALAGDFDVVVFWDADTIAHPDAVNEAVTTAAQQPVMVLAGDAHIYSDELSTRRYFDTGLMFPQPRGNKQRPFSTEGIYRRPCSGILAVGRPLWESTGGYIDSLGGEDSHEDLAFFQQCGLFGSGVVWCDGIQIHLWHPPAERRNGRNFRVWQKLAQLKKQRQVDAAKTYLAELGHHVP